MLAPRTSLLQFGPAAYLGGRGALKLLDSLIVSSMTTSLAKTCANGLREDVLKGVLLYNVSPTCPPQNTLLAPSEQMRLLSKTNKHKRRHT